MAKFPLEKIVAPGLPPTILRRTSLIASLAQAIGGDSSALGQETSWYKLILLCAPAGYGKTTVLADFARTNKMRCCWAHLEATEREMLTFLHLLLQSFRQTFPDFGSLLDGQLSAMLSRQRDNLDNGGHAEQFVDSLVAAIDSEIKENFALVLCDYHEVNERIEINKLMNHLLSKLPAVCTVVIESRSIPKLNFVPLLARRQIAGFGTEHLCFTAKDICDLTQLLHTAPLSLDEAEQMRQIYGGWIVGILLGTHLGRALLFPAKESQPIASDLMLPSEQNRSYLFAYLVSEVFAREQDVYTFLRELSLFSQLDPELCNIFLSITDAEKRLEHIEQQGLFVTHTTVEGRKIYTCHPVLRELMVKDLKEKDHALFKSLHDRAARLFYTLHDYHKAIPHAVEGEAYDLGVDLILECARPILRKGYSEILISWLDLLPTNVQERYPALLLMHARLCLMKYKLEDAHIFIEKALAALARLPQNETATIRSEALIIKSAALFQAGDYLATKQLCEQALAMLSLDERELRARAYQRLGACHCLLGQSITGVAYLQQALQLWGHDTEARQTALLHMYLANAYSNLGNYALAEHHRLRAIHGFDYINDIWGKIHGLIGLGATKRLWGMLSEAEKIIQQALDLARSTAFLSGQAYALLNLGEIYQDQSNYAQSLAMIEEGLEIAQGLQDKYLLNCTFCTLALTYLFMGDASSALFLISDSTLYSAPDTSYEGALLRLTRSIIFFQQRLYQQAEEILEPLNRALETTELKLLSIRVSLYMAACRLAQNKREQIQSLFAQVAVLIKQMNCEQIALVELGRLPELMQIARTLPEISWLWRNEGSSIPVFAQVSVPVEQPVLVTDTTVTAFQVFAFGEPKALVAGEPITRWRTARAMELFFFLLDANRPVHKEQIMTALWPEADEHIEQNMRTTVFHLRKVIGDQGIIYRSGTYALQLSTLYEKEIWYDVATFQRYATAAREIVVDDPVAATEIFQKMLRLYRGDYVQSFYNDWCRQRRQELRDLYIEAHQKIALFCWQNNQLDESLEHWQSIVTLDDCLEEAHVGMIRCYLGQGKRVKALRQYQRCVNILQEELGVEPGLALKKLAQQLT